MTPNKSLDASGGSVFLNLLGLAQGALIRAAASTQPFDGFSFMTFILVPSQGEDLQVNAWNWRPTLELLFAANVISEEDHERMGAHGSAGKVDAGQASRIADAVVHKLDSMNVGERMLANLSVSKEPKKLAEFGPGVNAGDIDENEFYSTTYEWLETFSKFCRSSRGFEVM